MAIPGLARDAKVTASSHVLALAALAADGGRGRRGHRLHSADQGLPGQAAQRDLLQQIRHSYTVRR